MVGYFTKDFFDEIASRLNADPEWSKQAGTLTVKLVLTCTDWTAAFLLDVQEGKVIASAVAPDVPADFKFEGPYDAWVGLGKGEKDFQTLVLTGKIRFRGSMPRIMGMLGPLNRITATAREIPKEF